MGPCAPPAPAHERRAPTIRAALLPTGSGPAPTRLLSYDAVTVEGRRHDLVVEPRRRADPQENQCQWRTGESTKKRIQVSAAQDEGMGPMVSIEHSLMDTRESPSSIL